MSITQFNATYVQEEDRVLFRFNTSEQQEFRLWLTRLAVKDLMGLTTQGTVTALAREHPVEQAKAIAEFKQQANAANPQFTTFVPATTLPLGAEPKLVRGMRLTVEAEKIALELILPSNQLLTMRLTQDMLGQISLLLHKIDEHAGWGVAKMLAAPKAQSEEEASLIEVPLAVDPPKRLH